MSEQPVASSYANLSMEFTTEFINVNPEDIEYVFGVHDFPNNDDEYWMAKALEHSPTTYRFLSDRLKKKKEFIEKIGIRRLRRLSNILIQICWVIVLS